MDGARKTAVGLLIFIGLIVWCLAPVFGQTMTFKFLPDGTMINEHDDPKGYSIERYDPNMRLLETSHYFPGGKRMKMFDKYRYENNMMAERIAYIYTQGYERETYVFNRYGYETEYHHYVSKTEGNWKEDQMTQQGYDERNNVNYFRSKGTRFGYLINKMSRTNYDYANRTRSVVEYEYDANDREISSSSFRSGLADWHFDNAGTFIFDINKHAPNLRPNRVVKWEGTDKHGNRVEKVFVDHEAVTRTFDQNGRVIHIGLGTHNFGDDNKKPIETYKEVIDFVYDRQGRLIQTESKHYSDAKEKIIYEHGRNVVAKRYRMNSNGGWKLVSTKSYANIDEFTPPVRGNGFVSSGVASSVNQNEPNWEPAPNTNTLPSQATKPMSTQSLVNDLNALNIESNEETSLNAFALDAEKLSHIADVLSHTTGTHVSEEQVLALAMQLLIQNYNADLREMNTQYLRDKVSVFD